MSRFRTTTKKKIALECQRFLIAYKATIAKTEKEAKYNFHEFSENIAIFSRLFDPTTAVINSREIAYDFYHSQVKAIKQELEQ
jgi:hypothetical protein